MSKVKGVDSVNSKFSALVGKITTTTSVEAATRAMIIGQQYATMLTPVDTSNLINGRFMQIIPTATGVTGRAGYMASYAPYVHNGGPKNWQKPGAEDEFLTKGFERDGRAEIDAVIKATYERG